MASPVVIEYSTLLQSPHVLSDAIQEAFGPDALGVIVIKDLPREFPALRERLLRLGDKFASLPEGRRERYARKELSYMFGWSHGKEIMNGLPDVNKGSFYANPLLDRPNVSEEMKSSYGLYYGDNVWPESDELGVAGFEDAFKALGRLIYHVGMLLAQACEPFVSPHVHASARNRSITEMISSSQCNKARLLHYYPSTSSSSSQTDGRRKMDRQYQENEVVVKDDACGIHLDHSLLTGLCSAMYLFHPQTEDGSREIEPEITNPPDETAGLWVCPRRAGSKPVKISIPPDCLAFQTGEALQLLTGGRLSATPHFVRGGAGQGSVTLPDGRRGQVSRETFAFFLQPDVDKVVGSDGETFGAFSERIMTEHYGDH